MYELKGSKLPRAFRTLPHSVAPELGIMKQESPTRSGVELDKQIQFVESRTSPGTPASSLVKMEDAVLAASPSSFRASDGINITVSRARCSI